MSKEAKKCDYCIAYAKNSFTVYSQLGEIVKEFHACEMHRKNGNRDFITAQNEAWNKAAKYGCSSYADTKVISAPITFDTATIDESCNAEAPYMKLADLKLQHSCVWVHDFNNGFGAVYPKKENSYTAKYYHESDWNKLWNIAKTSEEEVTRLLNTNKSLADRIEVQLNTIRLLKVDEEAMQYAYSNAMANNKLQRNKIHSLERENFSLRQQHTSEGAAARISELESLITKQKEVLNNLLGELVSTTLNYPA